MKKWMLYLVAASAISPLTACGNDMPTTQMANFRPAPQMVQAPANDLQAQSLLGINKEISKAVSETFKRKDANGDKSITPDEFPVKNADDFVSFRKLDDNKDGKLVEKELAPSFFGRIKDVLQLKASASFLFDQLDRNNDSKLSPQEAAASTLPGIATNFDRFRDKPWWSAKKLDYLRKTDFENLVAFALTNPAAATPSAPTDGGAPAPVPAK